MTNHRDSLRTDGTQDSNANIVTLQSLDNKRAKSVSPPTDDDDTIVVATPARPWRPEERKTQKLLPVGMDVKFTLHKQGSSSPPQMIRFCKAMFCDNKPSYETLQQMIVTRFRKHITMLPGRLVSVPEWKAYVLLDGRQYALSEWFWREGMDRVNVVLGDRTNSSTPTEARILVERSAVVRPQRKKVVPATTQVLSKIAVAALQGTGTSADPLILPVTPPSSPSLRTAGLAGEKVR